MIKSKATVERLQRAGWSQGRRIDVREIEEQVLRCGFSVNPIARQFLAEFNGLIVSYPHWNGHGEDRFVIDALAACDESDVDELNQASDVVGPEMTPVGLIYSDHMVVCISSNGRVAGVFGDTLCEFGDSPVKALSLICEGRKPTNLRST